MKSPFGISDGEAAVRELLNGMITGLSDCTSQLARFATAMKLFSLKFG